MSHTQLECINCGHLQLDDAINLSCLQCSAPLQVKYTDKESGHPTGIESLTPVHNETEIITLGEGNTPVVHLLKVGDVIGLDNLFAKLEFMNPTGSFKDRGSSMMLTMAKEHGVTKLVEDSSGNAGASVAAYAAKANIKAHIFAPSSTPQPKIEQIKIYGATCHLIEGSRNETTKAAMKFAKTNHIPYLSHSLSPYFIEGNTSFLRELVAQLRGKLPDHIVIPVGNGALLLGIMKSLHDDLNILPKQFLPRIHCVQSENVNPIVRAFKSLTKITDQLSKPTIAGGIAVSAPPRIHQVLCALESTGGQAISVSEDSIVKWHKILPSVEGLDLEPTSAAAVAGVELLVQSGYIKPKDRVLIPITGSGLKHVEI